MKLFLVFRYAPRSVRISAGKIRESNDWPLRQLAAMRNGLLAEDVVDKMRFGLTSSPDYEMHTTSLNHRGIIHLHGVSTDGFAGNEAKQTVQSLDGEFLSTYAARTNNGAVKGMAVRDRKTGRTAIIFWRTSRHWRDFRRSIAHI